jgi:pyruvate kinase
MNFSHGDYDYHQSVIDNTRKMVEGMHDQSCIDQSVNVGLPADPNGRPVAIALDTVGYFLPSSLARFLI